MLRQRRVVYDVGRALGTLSVTCRPDYSPAMVRRELAIIREDLHVNAVRLCGRDPRRLLTTADYAASLGLDVWVCPELWNGTPKRTLRYITEAAAATEPLRRRWPEQLTFCVGNEVTLFMRGIVPGRTHSRRAHPPTLRDMALSGQHTPPSARSLPTPSPRCAASTPARSATAPCSSNRLIGTCSTG